MPLYDCMLLLKPHIKKEAILDLVARVGKHVYRRNGVLTDIKSFGQVQLGYGIKKLDGRYYQGQLMQMTMMTTPNMNKELHYLNKEDRLLRWLLVKHRDTKFGLDFVDEDDGKVSLFRFSGPSSFMSGDIVDKLDDTTTDDFVNISENEDEVDDDDNGNKDSQGGK